MKYAVVDRLRQEHAVRLICRVLGVSASGYYAWRKRPEARRSREDRQLVVRIRAIHKSTKRRYGSPRIHHQLRDEGIRCGRKRVERLMRQDGLVGIQARRYRVMPKHDPSPPAPDLVRRQFEVEVPDAVWAGDMTYLWTPQGWVFLAVVLDLFSRRIVGWALSRKADARLMIRAMERAVYERRPRSGLVSHSDQGCQYTSASYRDFAKDHGIQLSMSRRGNPWDNAVVESFFATLKTELGDTFLSFDSARRELFEYIEGFYNTRRIHTAIGWMSPAQYEALHVRIAA